MSKRISFKLHGEPKKLALALQHQLYQEGTSLSLDQIVERMFVNWMYRNLQSSDNPTTSVRNTDGSENSEEYHVATSTSENAQGHSEPVASSVHSDASSEST